MYVHSVNSGLINSLVEGEQVDEVGTEAVLRTKADLHAAACHVSALATRPGVTSGLPLHVFNDLDSS